MSSNSKIDPTKEIKRYKQVLCIAYIIYPIINITIGIDTVITMNL